MSTCSLSRLCSKNPYWCFIPFRPLPMLLSHPKAWIKNILHSQRWLIYAWFICLEKQKVFFLWLVRPLTLYRRYGHALILSTCRKRGGFALYFVQEEHLLYLKLSGPWYWGPRLPRTRVHNRNKSRVRVSVFHPGGLKLSSNPKMCGWCRVYLNIARWKSASVELE